MAVAFEVRTRFGGEPIGRCTARCYDAEPGSKCQCVCHGRNHGKGVTYAMAHSRELAERWGEVATVELAPESAQSLLFDLEDQ